MKKILLALFLCGISLVEGSPLKIGLARVEISPPVGYVMGGYSSREGGSTGIHDPLYATAVVMDTGQESLAIVALDLRSFPSERVRRQVRDTLGIRHVMLCSSHTHSGPLTWEDQTWPSPEQSWFSRTEEQLIQLIEQASREKFEATIQGSLGYVRLGHNRRRLESDGSVTMFWRNEKEEPTSPVDPSVKVVRISDREGNVRAVLVNYACHGVVLGPDNLEISADWPGFMRDRIEEGLGSGTYALFLQGASGDINPFLDKQPVVEGGFQKAKEAGIKIGDEVLRVVERIDSASTMEQGIEVREDLVQVKNRWKSDEEISVGVTTAVLGSQIGLTAWPGEAFVDFQLRFADLSPLPVNLFVGHCFSAGGVWAGYFPTIQAAAEGGYGASYNTTVAVGTGERLLRLSLRRILEMQGQMESVPLEFRQRERGED